MAQWLKAPAFSAWARVCCPAKPMGAGSGVDGSSCPAHWHTARTTSGVSAVARCVLALQPQRTTPLQQHTQALRKEGTFRRAL